MSLRADAIRTLTDWEAPEPSQDDLRGAYLRHLAGHPDALDRRCLPDHLTASAVVVSADHDQVLLTLHKRLRRWLQTGGHCEPADETLAAAALREAAEESGIDGLLIDPVPVVLSLHEVPCGPEPSAHHLDVQYVVVAPTGAREVVGDESEALGWFELDALPDVDASVRALVAGARTRLRQA